SCIAEDTGQPVARVEADSRRDRWFDAGEALEYGFVDHIITTLTDVLPGRSRTIGLGQTA
ncbi:MAG TPA: ATP-dependent Clp protease proteolytic subunit, partial [Propionicimonas sp.]|nr:ATP-dependent Clp protease proteolytic subunit [Propionicimonas sp.]